MSMWTKLGTLLRAGTHEPVEHIVDANALRIFEQEIREAEAAVGLARHQLAAVMAEGKQLQRHIKSLEESIGRREQQAISALDKDEAELANELAALIVEDEVLLRDQRQQAEHLSQQEAKLKRQLRDSLQSIERYKRELTLAKANRSARRALGQLQGCSSSLNTPMQEMEKSLQRIRAQEHRATDMDAALQELDAGLSGDHLNARLEKAGIRTGKHDAAAVLERLRKERAA